MRSFLFLVLLVFFFVIIFVESLSGTMKIILYTVALISMIGILILTFKEKNKK